MSFAQKILSAFGKLGVVLLLLITFGVGLGGVLYLALRSPEVKVPEIVGKDYNDGEKDLSRLDLKIRKRTDRFSAEKPNIILEQIPLPGDTVKAGQTISVVISRAQAEGDEKPAEVKKETVDKAKDPDDQSEVDKARAKRKAANVNKNVNINKNSNVNANLNSNNNSNLNNSNNSGNSNVGASNGNSNTIRGNSNARTNSNNVLNTNNRPASNSSNRAPAAPPTLIINRNSNNNRRPQ